jgi:hypothetical protein
MSSLLFSSGFESGVSLAAPGPYDGSEVWQNVTGTDATTGSAWPAHLWGGSSIIQELTFSSNTSSIIQNSIDTVTGHDGSQTQALHLNVLQKNNPSTQDPLLLMPAAAQSPTDFFISEWIKLPADLASRVGTGGWVTGTPEFKTAGDFRSVTAIEVDNTGTAHWHMSWDTNANGNVPLQTFWSSYNNSVPVPLGQWMHVDFSVHRGNTDGNVTLKINDQVVFDHTGDTFGVNNAPIDRIFVANPYSNAPMDMLVDDVQVRDGPAAGGTTPPVTPPPSASQPPATPITSTLVLNVSEDAWKGDAQFIVSVDGKQMGTYTATASHKAGASQAVQISGIAESFQPHDVALSFINDAYGGSASTDRNLYVNSAQFDGETVSGAAATLVSNNTHHFTATAPANWTG